VFFDILIIATNFLIIHKKRRFKMLLQRLLFILIFLLSFGLMGVNAQEAIPASGGDASGNGGSLSYSVGQILYSANTGEDGSINQGVQHPYEFFVVSETKIATHIFFEMSVYPNPSVDHLIVETNSHSLSRKTFYYQLFDLNGKLINNKKIEDNRTIINMSTLTSGSYFLKIIQRGNDLSSPNTKTFKIIKK